MSRILVIDNDTVVSAGIQIILERNGMHVVVVPDGRRAIEAIEAERFDIVIADIFMIGMDGLETVRMFRKRAPGVPIIALSGFMFRDSGKPAPDFLSMATELGAAYSFAKPYRPRDLLQAVKRCLAHEKDGSVPIATTQEPPPATSGLRAVGDPPAPASGGLTRGSEIPETLPPAASVAAAPPSNTLSPGETPI
jgi:CheY-like chemotaxis protein